MSVYIQEVLGLLKRNKKKTKLDKMRDHFEFGKLYNNSSLNTGAAYNPKMEPFVVKFGDLVCEVTENLTRTQPGSGNLGVVPVYTTPEGSCAWDTLMDSIITQNAVGDTINIAGDLYVQGTITTPTLTEDRVVIVGPGGVLEDDGNFTMDGVTFTALVNVQHGSITASPNVPTTTTTLNSNIILNGPVTDSQGNVGQLSQVLVGLGDGRVIWSDDDVVEALTYGSLWQGNINNLKQELPIGTADQILISDGTTFAWQDNPAAIVGEICAVYRIPLWTPDSNTLGCSLLIQDGNSTTPATKITNDGKLQQTKELFLDTVAQDDTLTEVLVRDTGASNEVKFRDVATIVPPVGFDTLVMSDVNDWTQTYLNAYVPLDDTSVAYMRIGGMTGLTDGQEGHVIAENVKSGALLAQDAIRFPNGWGIPGELWNNQVSWTIGANGMNGYKDTDTLLFGETLKFKYINYQAPGQANNVLFWDACCKLYSSNQCPVGTNQTLTTDENIAISSQAVVVDDGFGGYGLTYALQTNVSNGTLNFNTTTGQYTYTPATNYFGTDQFTYTATDGYCTTDPITVTIIVNAVAEPPIWTSSCPDTSSLIAGDVYTYNYTVSDPDHACNQLSVSFTLTDNATGLPATWLTNTYNNDCTGTITGTYPVTGGVFTLALTVTDTDTPANSTGQVCNIAGLVPDKDTFFNFWFDLSGSMDDIVNTIASNSSLARVYSQSDTGGTGTGTSTLQMNPGIGGLRRVDVPLNVAAGWNSSSTNGNSSWWCVRPGMSVSGPGILPGTFVAATNFTAIPGQMTLEDAGGNAIIHTVAANTELTFELTATMIGTDYTDINNLRNTFQDFYATGQTYAQETAAGVPHNSATNGVDGYNSHIIWCHDATEHPIDGLANRGLGQAGNGALDVGPVSDTSQANADWFFDATQIFMFAIYDESCCGGARYFNFWDTRNTSTGGDTVGDTQRVVNTFNNTSNSVTLRGICMNMEPNAGPAMTGIWGYNGAFTVGLNTPIPFSDPTVASAAIPATAYQGTSVDTLYSNYAGGSGIKAIRPYPTTEVGFTHNGYLGVVSNSSANPGSYYFNAFKAALLDHGLIL